MTELTERVVIEKTALEHDWVIDREGIRTRFVRDDLFMVVFWASETGRITEVVGPWMSAPTTYAAEWVLENLRRPAEQVDRDHDAEDRGHDAWVDRQVGL